MYSYSDFAERWENYVLDAMYNTRDDACKAISCVVGAEMVDEFSKVLSYGWSEGLPEARKLAERLNLTQKEFSAIDDNYKDFEEILSEEIDTA